MKRNPALNVAQVMAPAPARGGPGLRIMKTQAAAAATSANDRKNGVSGARMYKRPPSDGPTIRDADWAEEYQVMALAKCSRGTRLGVSACAAGLAKARATPPTKTQA